MHKMLPFDKLSAGTGNLCACCWSFCFCYCCCCWWCRLCCNCRSCIHHRVQQQLQPGMHCVDVIFIFIEWYFPSLFFMSINKGINIQLSLLFSQNELHNLKPLFQSNTIKSRFNPLCNSNMRSTMQIRAAAPSSLASKLQSAFATPPYYWLATCYNLVSGKHVMVYLRACWWVTAARQTAFKHDSGKHSSPRSWLRRLTKCIALAWTMAMAMALVNAMQDRF